MDAARLGFSPDTVIQELGWDEDVDNELRSAIEEIVGNALVDAERARWDRARAEPDHTLRGC